MLKEKIIKNKIIKKALLSVTLLISVFTNPLSAQPMADGVESGNSCTKTLSQTKPRQSLKEGLVNELSQEEKDYFEKLLENKYKIIKQAGWSGARTSAYLMNGDNGEEFILKMSNDPDDKTWIQGQKETWEKIKKITANWKGAAQVPNYVYFGDTFIVEKYLGEDFNPQIYDNLSNEEKQTVAKNLAEFLVFIHSQNPTDKNISLLRYFNSLPFSIKKCINCFKNAISSEQEIQLLGIIEKLEKMDTSDEYKTTCHHDIRWQNVLYNSKTKKIAVIDFELTAGSNRYIDFGCNQSFGLSYVMLSNTIDEYNKISDKKINKEKAKLFCQISSIMEYCMATKLHENKTAVKDINVLLNVFIFPTIAAIEKGFSG